MLYGITGTRRTGGSLMLAGLTLLGTAASGAGAEPPAANARFSIVAAGHTLKYQDGSPFFWLGDTAWRLCRSLDRGEVERYLEDRRRKGFNVIQAVVIMDGPHETNAYGAPAFVDRDPTRPAVTAGADPANPAEYDFWDHVDFIVDRAAEKGLFVAMVAAWGHLVQRGAINADNVAAYTTWLAERYKGRPNVIWIVGGDTPGDENRQVWRTMGETIKKVDPDHLVTFHPFGRTQSSSWFHDEPWLDLNMFQSGHRRYDQDPGGYGEDNWRYVEADLAKTPRKPTLDGEPSYEGIPQGLHDTSQPYWTDADSRRYAYWSVFAGACGHTYGNNAVMQMHKPTVRRGFYGPRNFWYEAIDDPGAAQMQHLQRLVLSRPYFERRPDPSVIEGKIGGGHERLATARGEGYAFVYDYTGRPFSVRLGILSGERVAAWWYDPRTGEARNAGSFDNRGTRRFEPPPDPRPQSDWVLVLDDASRRFPPPGASFPSAREKQ